LISCPTDTHDEDEDKAAETREDNGKAQE